MIHRLTVASTLVGILLAGSGRGAEPGLPTALVPPGYALITCVSWPVGPQPYLVAAFARADEARQKRATGIGPARPVIVFRPRPGGGYEPIGRNDDVAMRAGEGLQCNAFNDSYPGLVATGRRFTVQNGVACGQHWTDFITFRFDPARHAVLFDREIMEELVGNNDPAPDAEALVAGPRSERRADPHHLVSFTAFRPHN